MVNKPTWRWTASASSSTHRPGELPGAGVRTRTGSSRRPGACTATEASAFTLPTGIAVGPDGKVYVADGDAHRIMVFPPGNNSYCTPSLL